MSVDYAWTFLKRTQLLCVICTDCEQPALVCHGPQLPCVRHLHSSGFMPTLRSGSSPSPTQQRAGHIACTNYPRMFGLHEIFKCAHLKFTVLWPQTDIHTINFRKCSHTSVRLAPTRKSGQKELLPCLLMLHAKTLFL